MIIRLQRSVNFAFQTSSTRPITSAVCVISPFSNPASFTLAHLSEIHSLAYRRVTETEVGGKLRSLNRLSRWFETVWGFTRAVFGYCMYLVLCRSYGHVSYTVRITWFFSFFWYSPLDCYILSISSSEVVHIPALCASLVSQKRRNQNTGGLKARTT